MFEFKIIVRGAILVDITLLETCGLVKKYSGRAVVNEISITIAQRSIVGLLGRNGAGKTTTFRMIMGMITPDAGLVIFEGQNITKLPMYRRARLGIGYLSQEPSIFQRLSVRNNLYAIVMFVSKRKIRKRITELEDSVKIREKGIENLKKSGFKTGDSDSFCIYNSKILNLRRSVVSINRIIEELKDLL